MPACDWKKPKPLASSSGIRLRSDTSLTSITQPDRRRGLLAAGAHRHVAGDHRDLGLEVDAPGFVGSRDRIARTEEAVGAALVHQRIGPEARRHLGAARFAHQLDVVHVGRAVGPLVGARQRRGASCSWKRNEGTEPMFELRRQSARQRRDCSQSSRAACSVGTMKKASVARVRSLETTTSRPSRPCLSDESFMSHSCRLHASLGPELVATIRINCGETPYDDRTSTMTQRRQRGFLTGARALPPPRARLRRRRSRRPLPEIRWRLTSSFPKAARHDLRHRPDLRQLHGRGDRQQVPDPDLRRRASSSAAFRRSMPCRTARSSARHTPTYFYIGKDPTLGLRHRPAVRPQCPPAAFLVAFRRRQGDHQRGASPATTRRLRRAATRARRWAASSARRSTPSTISTA